ncbi:SAM-dependent methyltransferase [Mycobacterium intermedium]|uniref:S-adenosyl-L-methionine-dependent methyltransferase n=1 Tax=Mycobacterium intermedium TaxID=28445 RepID=A0A1E3SIM8_MYCIE|nr:SAM-dependent methyltransferase [Mycobacterium intermedium]MCV6967172.1 SAM-dependent methyltransferase [Mycobacterium intermedium]ODR02000.1 methyltransferase [Mycobacterium intermedium]OPE45174.1 SAM-dependent methyltransferase [Mycobacterium intermedium]ORB05777.1 SAM-dependent methyltransferase [Mycobacterium intermedium]
MVAVADRRLDRTASLTAQLNAAQRAAETLRPPGRRLIDDPYSRHFVEHPALRAVLAHPRLADAALRGIDRLWGGLHAHIMLRVRYADDAFDAVIRDGIDQVVLLGAGFDTTSLRRGTTGVRVFEVDAPTTQAHKWPVVQRLLSARRECEITWVPCDFEHRVLRECLIGSGYDPSRPSLIIWLGVTPYLTRGAIDATLADLAEICAPGSRLVVDYIRAGVAAGRTPWKSADRVARMVARRGEPYRSDFTEAGFDAVLTDHLFKPREHLPVEGLLNRYDPARRSGLSGDSWLAVATAIRV